MSYLRQGCSVCGEKDILVLEFDHLDPSIKKHNISRLLSNGRSKEVLIRELEKCRVICTSCHARHTAIQVNSWRLEYTKGV